MNDYRPRTTTATLLIDLMEWLAKAVFEGLKRAAKGLIKWQKRKK
jgi:hypothetical protein